MTKVIKGEFEKLVDVKVEYVLLTCDPSLEVFNNKINLLNVNDYSEQQVSHDADDDIGYDPSDVSLIEWLRSKFFNYKMMDHNTMKALWMYWIRGDDEVELTDEESFDSEDDVAEVFRIDTNIFDFETPLDYKDDWIYEWNENVPWVYDKPWLDIGIWKEPTPVKHHCKPFNYKTGCSEWKTCSWREDGYCNGGNLPGAYVIRNSLHYQDLEWYGVLKDSELKKEALRNKAIMEGLIEEDNDDESCYERKKRWNVYRNYDDTYEINHEIDEREELCKTHELLVCNIRRFMMIKYSFGQDE
ncbi:hypothetical protein Tco_1372911 [Tanacetum coccineum]